MPRLSKETKNGIQTLVSRLSAYSDLSTHIVNYVSIMDYLAEIEDKVDLILRRMKGLK